MWQRSACLIQHLAPLVPQIGIEESNKLDHQDDCVFFLLPNSKSQTLRRLLYLLGLLFVNNNMNMLCRCYADAEAIFFWWNLVSTPEALQIVSLLLPQKRQRQILIVFPWFPFDVQVKDFIKATVATIGYRYHLWNMFEPTSYF